MTIKQLFLDTKKIKDQSKHEFEGWIINNRGIDKIRFLSLNDGSTINTLQLVVKDKDIKKFNIDKISLGTSIKVSGLLLLTPKAAQPFELVVNNLEVINLVDENSKERNNSWLFKRNSSSKT